MILGFLSVTIVYLSNLSSSGMETTFYVLSRKDFPHVSVFRAIFFARVRMFFTSFNDMLTNNTISLLCIVLRFKNIQTFLGDGLE